MAHSVSLRKLPLSSVPITDYSSLPLTKVGCLSKNSHCLWWKYPRHWLLFNESAMSQPQKTAYYFFSASPYHCCKQDCCESSICQALHGQAAATRGLCGKVEAGVGKSVGFPSHLLVSSWCTGTDSQHRLLPWEMGWAVETAPIDLTAFHPPHLYTSGSMAGSAVLEWRHSYCWSELLAPRHGSCGTQSGCRRWIRTQLKALGLFRSWREEGTG